MRLDPKHVAPTLAQAVRDLGKQTERGFVFVRADGSERYIPFADSAGSPSGAPPTSTRAASGRAIASRSRCPTPTSSSSRSSAR